MKRATGFVLLTLFIAVGYGLGCSLQSLELKKVPSDFDVFVTHRNKPIARIRVVIQKVNETRPAFEGLTDDHGSVHIFGLARGEYFLTASHLGFDAGKEWIEVMDAASVDDKMITRFDFQWAELSYETNRVAGVLTGLVPGNTGNKLKDVLNPVSVVYPGVELVLKNAFSDENYRGLSDSTGSFIFGPIPAGIYLLAIAGGQKSIAGIGNRTELILDVIPYSRRDFIKLKLQDTGCYRVEYALDEQ